MASQYHWEGENNTKYTVSVILEGELGLGKSQGDPSSVWYVMYMYT